MANLEKQCLHKNVGRKRKKKKKETTPKTHRQKKNHPTNPNPHNSKSQTAPRICEIYLTRSESKGGNANLNQDSLLAGVIYQQGGVGGVCFCSGGCYSVLTLSAAVLNS